MSDLICRIKRDSSTFYAKPMCLKNNIEKEELINCDLSSMTEKEISEIFVVTKDSKIKKDRWAFYNYDINFIPEEIIPYFLIDKKMRLYRLIVDIIRERGYKFNKISSLKRHIYLSLLDEGISHDILKIAINYFFEKRMRSKHDRTKRFVSKAYCNLDIWNYAVTFTYDSNLLTAEEFIKKLKTFLANNASKKKWVYMGSFEKSPSGRDHFHCLMSIPKDDIKSLNLESETYYNKQTGKMDEALISTSLKEKFGRVHFQEIDPYSDDFVFVLEYICKYISKQENKIIYSKGIKDEFIGEISDFEEHCIGFLYPNSSYYMMDQSIKDTIKKL